MNPAQRCGASTCALVSGDPGPGRGPRPSTHRARAVLASVLRAVVRCTGGSRASDLHKQHARASRVGQGQAAGLARTLGQRLLASRRVRLAPAWPRARWPRMEGSSDPAPATPRAPVAGSGAGARAPRRRPTPRSIDEARGSALAPTLRDSRSGRADLRNGPDGRPRSPQRQPSAPPSSPLRPPPAKRRACAGGAGLARADPRARARQGDDCVACGAREASCEERGGSGEL